MLIVNLAKFGHDLTAQTTSPIHLEKKKHPGHQGKVKEVQRDLGSNGRQRAELGADTLVSDQMTRWPNCT